MKFKKVESYDLEFSESKSQSTPETHARARRPIPGTDNDYLWKNISDSSQCVEALELFGGYIKKYNCFFYSDYFTSLLTEARYPRYLNSVKDLFSNTSFNLSSNSNFIQCSKNKDEIIYIENLYLNFLRIGYNISKVDLSSYNEAHNYAKQMSTLFVEMQPFRNNEKALHDRLKKPCDWLRNESKPNLKKFKRFKNAKNTVLSKYRSISHNFHQLNDSFFNLLPKLEMGRMYLENHVKKLELAKYFENNLFRKTFQDVSYYAKELEASVQFYISEMDTFLDQIKLAYEEIFALKRPVINSHNVYHLKLVTEARDTKDIETMSIVQSLKENYEENILKLWKIIFERLTTYKTLLKSSVFLPVDEFSTKVSDFSADLRKYKDSLQVGTGFLM